MKIAILPGDGIGMDFPNFSDTENRGKNLFMRPVNAGGMGCAGCHQAPTFALIDNSLSNGLDQGETRIFKSPSLKNVSIGGPYMQFYNYCTHNVDFACLHPFLEIRLTRTTLS